MLGFFSVENDQRRAAVGFVAEGNDRRMLLQQRLDDLALHANSPAVDDADLVKASLHRLIEVFLDDNVDLFRLKRMEVDGIFDWDVVHGESI